MLNCPPAAEPAKPSTKAATKNAKRKEKKAAEGGEAAAVVVEGLQGLSLGAAAPAAEPKAGAAAAPPAAPAADGEQPAGGHVCPTLKIKIAACLHNGAIRMHPPAEPPSVEKQARALRKKIRQCDGLVAKAAEGAALTPEEAAKLANLPAWEAAAAALEAQG